MVPAETVVPTDFSTGRGSPVSIDSLTELSPSTTSPSAGILPPGKILIRSLCCNSATGNSQSD